jgi:hypothetical protein
MGAWSHLALKLQNLLGKTVRYSGRDASSSPATGSLAIHNLEQAQLVQEAFGVPPSTKPVLSKKATPKSSQSKSATKPKRKKR